MLPGVKYGQLTTSLTESKCHETWTQTIANIATGKKRVQAISLFLDSFPIWPKIISQYGPTVAYGHEPGRPSHQKKPTPVAAEICKVGHLHFARCASELSS